MQTVAPFPSPTRLRDQLRAACPGARQLGYRQGRERLLDRHVDDGALSGGHHRVHAGAGGRDAADKGGLFADRADRLLVEIIDLAGQHARDAAREKQRQIGRRIVGLRPGLAIGRNQHERRVRVQRAQRLGIAVPRPQRPRPPLADDQIGLSQRLPPDRLACRCSDVRRVASNSRHRRKPRRPRHRRTAGRRPRRPARGRAAQREDPKAAPSPVRPLRPAPARRAAASSRHAARRRSRTSACASRGRRCWP